jgi:hypothetical protein
MADDKPTAQDSTHEHGAPVPKFLVLVYVLIAAFFVYYLATGLKFGGGSPTGF